MVTMENIRRAADAFRDNEVAVYGEFSDEVRDLFNSAATEFIDRFDVADYEDYEDSELIETIASDFCDAVANEMEYARDYYGVQDEWTDGIVYTRDIWDYYHSNQNECDEYLGEIDLAGYESVTEIVAALVAYARNGIAYDELSEAIETVRDGADEMKNYLV